MTEETLFKQPEQISEGEATTGAPPVRKNPHDFCVVCEAELKQHEKPQRRGDAGLCDRCARGHQTR